jgi:hypothetical protein
MSEIRNIRIPPRIERLPVAEEQLRRGPQQAGWRFTVDGQEFDFRNGRILLNQQDVAQHLNENLTHLGTQYWSVLSKRLAAYRDWASMNMEDPEALGKFFGLMHAFLTKIFGRIKKKFDETIDGVSFHLEDGQLLINGINVGACLKMVQKKPTQKGRIFLKGIRNRLLVLQENRSGNPSYEKIRESVDRFAAAIDKELKTSLEIIYLPPPAAQLEPSGS